MIANNNVSDALAREIMILVQLERYEKALKVLEENHFKQWEGISKAYNSYVDAHIFLGWSYYVLDHNDQDINDPCARAVLNFRAASDILDQLPRRELDLEALAQQGLDTCK